MPVRFFSTPKDKFIQSHGGPTGSLVPFVCPLFNTKMVLEQLFSSFSNMVALCKRISVITLQILFTDLLFCTLMVFGCKYSVMLFSKKRSENCPEHQVISLLKSAALHCTFNFQLNLVRISSPRHNAENPRLKQPMYSTAKPKAKETPEGRPF